MSQGAVSQLALAQTAAAWKSKALSLGFDLAGIAPTHPSAYRTYLRQWLDEGKAGTMDWLSKRFEERADPAVYLPGARSALCVAANYRTPLGASDQSSDNPHGRIARYALGDDYHDVFKPRLLALADWLRERHPGAQTKAAVDTAPVLEKELAARAGIGWMGKNTCIINREVGSWLLLGEVITTLDLPSDDAADDHCGSCTRCIDACPTGAITAPYRMDATRCISYLTIEHRGEVSEGDETKIGEWLYGCDVCQDVCPHNRRAPASDNRAWEPRFETGTLALDAVASWSNDEYRTRLRGSAMRRVKLPLLQRNARLVRENHVRSGSLKHK